MGHSSALTPIGVKIKPFDSVLPRLGDGVHSSERGTIVTEKSTHSEVGSIVRSLRDDLEMSQEMLARLAGTTQTTIDKIERGLIRRTRFLPEIAAALKVPVSAIDKSYLSKDGVDLADDTRALIKKRDEQYKRGEIPIYATYEPLIEDPEIRLRNPFVVGKAPLRFAPKPEMFDLGEDGYCLYVSNASMRPEFESGDVIIVSPALPIVDGCSCVFYAAFGRLEIAHIARLESHDDKSWRTKKWALERSSTLGRGVWSKCHRIVGRHMR